MSETYPNIKPVGDSTILVEYEQVISLEVNLKVRRLAHALEKHPFVGMREVVPAYRALMVFFDPLAVRFEEVYECITGFLNESVEIELPQPRMFNIPTVYGGAHGPDLDRVAEEKGLTPDEVVRIFSSDAYFIYFLGFLCALPYLGVISSKLEIPRLASPRPFIPVGSVGIGGRQANVNPVDLPSGFNYLGRIFVKIYDPTGLPPTILRPGDYMRFPSVSEDEARAAAQNQLGDFLESP